MKAQRLEENLPVPQGRYSVHRDDPECASTGSQLKQLSKVPGSAL